MQHRGGFRLFCPVQIHVSNGKGPCHSALTAKPEGKKFKKGSESGSPWMQFWPLHSTKSVEASTVGQVEADLPATAATGILICLSDAPEWLAQALCDILECDELGHYAHHKMHTARVWQPEG
jgi:hypothetical protein